jgi:Leucine-rich repeat (LRR) protein
LLQIETGAFSRQADALEELVLANNALSQWPPLGNLGKLKTINLNGNALTGVSENAFAGMPNLQELWLGQNQICQLSP